MTPPTVRHRRLQKPVAEINVVPYIDVMLVLLVIFMVTAPLLHQGVEVTLPKATAKPIEQSDLPPVLITVDRKGNIYLNTHERPEEKLNSTHLIAALKTIRQESPKRQIVIRGDESVRYGKVIEVMVNLQSAGIVDVGLMTEDPNA